MISKTKALEKGDIKIKTALKLQEAQVKRAQAKGTIGGGLEAQAVGILGGLGLGAAQGFYTLGSAILQPTKTLILYLSFLLYYLKNKDGTIHVHDIVYS